jgi:hypothetical protein
MFRRARAVAIAAVFLWAGATPTLADHEPVPQDHFEMRPYMAGATDRYFGQFRYERELTTPGLDAPAGWRDGDRVKYACSWAPGHYRGFTSYRVTYVSRGGPNGGGASINDRYMLEGTRRYDGTLDPRHGTRIQFDEDCTNPPSGDGVTGVAPLLDLPDLPAAYENFCAPQGPKDCKAVVYHGPHNIEVRDMADLDDTTVPVHPSLRIRETQVTETGVWFAGYERLASGEWRARLEIRFDLIGDVEQGVAQGEPIPGTAHPVEIRTTLEPHEDEPEPSPAPQPTEDPSPEPNPLTADFDGDGDVDLDDLGAFIEAWIAQFAE